MCNWLTQCLNFLTRLVSKWFLCNITTLFVHWQVGMVPSFYLFISSPVEFSLNCLCVTLLVFLCSSSTVIISFLCCCRSWWGKPVTTTSFPQFLIFISCHSQWHDWICINASFGLLIFWEFTVKSFFRGLPFDPSDESLTFVSNSIFKKGHGYLCMGWHYFHWPWKEQVKTLK